jgi:hypothetical protein
MSKNKTLAAVIVGGGIAIALLAARARAAPSSPTATQQVLPVQSSCSLPQSVPAGQDGTATVTVIAGNVPRNIVFQILKSGVVCATSAAISIPGDSALRTYSVIIPAATCLGVPGDYSIAIQMVQWLNGDLNHNGISADSEDLILMEKANRGEITATPEYDLNQNGIPADAGDLELIRLASAGYTIAGLRGRENPMPSGRG